MISMPMKIRKATLRDLELLVVHRRGMWLDMGYTNKRLLDAADPVYRQWAKKRLKTGELVGWVIEVNKNPIASGCVWIMQIHPRPSYKGGPQPYLLSMYTEPEFRGRGLAKKIVLESLRWAKKKGFPLMTLHASDMGKNIYAKAGFKPTNEMKFDLQRPPQKS